MLRKIEALRKAPPHVRNRYAFWVALVVTLLILGVWSLSIPARLSPHEQSVEKAGEEGGFVAHSIRSIFNSINEYFAPTNTETPATTTPDIERVDLLELVPDEVTPVATSTGTSTATSSASTTAEIN